MHAEQFDFYFERSGRAGYEGPNDPSGEYFTSVEIEKSLTREIIQNSLDARAEGSQVVEVDFDLMQMATSEIPGVDALRSAIDGAVHASAKLQGLEYLKAAQTSAESTSVPVLCIGDTGTKGLTGSESRDCPQTPLSMLTRSTGASSSEGGRGGSFGIGSAVGPVASRMRTVAYISKPYDTDQVVFAATSKLASHIDAAGEWRLGTGYYTRTSRADDFEYPRGIKKVGSFPSRVSNGTDMYVFDYRGAEGDPDLHKIRRAAVDNFWVAIYREQLIVRGSTEKSSWVLNRETLEATIRSDDELRGSVLPFFRALTEGERVDGELDSLGPVELFVSLDEDLDQKMGTQLMRRPLMLIDTIKHSVVSVPYAAVFICSNEKGNGVLREIEPPTHDRWNDQGPRSNAKAVTEVKRFIREELKRLVPLKLGETATIKGLAKFLPSENPEGSAAGGVRGGSKTRDSTDRETALKIPITSPSLAHDWRADRTVSLTFAEVAKSTEEGDGGGESGNPGGDGGSREPSGKGRDTNVAPGDGRSRLRAESLSFRSFKANGQDVTTIVVRSERDQTGDLTLAALGARSREAFDLSLESVESVPPGAFDSFDPNGATIRGLSLVARKPLTLKLKFAGMDRYKLGVKDDQK